MSAIWHDHGQPSFLAIGPSFSFHEMAEVREICPAAYAEAREEMNAREHRLGAAWYRHNSELARAAWIAHRPWWL